MNDPFSGHLDKILALADSSYEGEAVVAVRKARQLLTRQGLSFADLARAARGHHQQSPAATPEQHAPFTFFHHSQTAQFEAQVTLLRRQLAELQEQFQTQTLQLEFWRRHAADLDVNLGQSRADAERWRQLARESIERLWDIGHAAHAAFGMEEGEEIQENSPEKAA
jgi:hypothetical protein